MKKILISILIIFIICMFSGGCSSANEPAAGLPKDPKDMTNKQKQEYYDWLAKQQQKEWENAPAYKN